MTDVERYQPETLPPNGGRFTHVTKIGPMVFIAGQTGRNEKGDLVGAGDAAAQAQQVFKNLKAAIESVGGKMSDFVKTTVYVVGRENLDAYRAAREGQFGDKPPGSTLLLVDGLALPEYVIEIDGIAYVE